VYTYFADVTAGVAKCLCFSAVLPNNTRKYPKHLYKGIEELRNIEMLE
jgi:hypothetical protein